jgi:hypothetical protein
MRTLCGLVHSLKMSRLAFFRFTPEMSLLVPFLFGLSYGLEVYPILVTEKGTDIIPSDLQGFDRIDYQSFEDFNTHLAEKMPSYLNDIESSTIPGEWAKFDIKTKEALSQIQNFISLPSPQVNGTSANEDKMQIALALGLYAIRCSAGSLMVITPNKRLRIKALVAPSAEMDEVGAWREFDISEGICGWVATNKTPYRTGDRQIVNGNVTYKPRSFDKNLMALACVPVIYQGDVVGVINADSREQDFFREGDIEVLSIVANMLAPFVADEAHHFSSDEVTEASTEVEAELRRGHTCTICHKKNTIVLGFKRIDDKDGLRYRMYLRCSNCNVPEEIRTYILRST